jgi:two-component system chemotaxis response regulator CheY
MSKRVIVIDDSKTIRDHVRSVLEKVGFEIVDAVDGQDGFAKIRDMTDLCLAICDVNMPVMTGIAMLEALKSGGINQKLPIVMLTTEGQPSLIQKAKAAGARGWIVKPFKPEQLVAAVQKLTGSA